MPLTTVEMVENEVDATADNGSNVSPEWLGQLIKHQRRPEGTALAHKPGERLWESTIGHGYPGQGP